MCILVLIYGKDNGACLQLYETHCRFEGGTNEPMGKTLEERKSRKN